MSDARPIRPIVATVVVLVLAVALLSCGDDDEPATPGSATTTPASTITTETPQPPAADHEPAFETINVAGGEPEEGVAKITVKSGSRARIQVASQDTSDEVHIHGYDLKRDLKAGDSVRFSFDADAEGIFEIELHSTHTQIGELVVEP